MLGIKFFRDFPLIFSDFVKKNLYWLLVDNFGLDTVPYGILHGVRPTKIIQRWIDENFGVTSHGVIDRDKICRRVCSDF